MSIKGCADSAEAATRIFRTFEEGKPELLPIGIDFVDDAIGGLFPGTLVIAAMDTGVGKSRLALGAALRFAEVHGVPGESAGIISVEDPEDVVGARLLAWASGVDSRKIRKKDLTNEEIDDVANGIDYLRELDERGSAPKFAYRIGGGLDDILDATEELAEAGCKVIWLDFLQKVRGVSDDRRNEVGTVMVQYQRACNRLGVVPCALSQFSRRQDSNREPRLWHLKESGDIENECRLALLGWQTDPDLICVKIEKSTFGGGGERAYFKTMESGMLEPVTTEERFEGPYNDF